MRTVATLLLLIGLAACGSRTDLKPAPGEPLPPQPQQAAEPQTTADLLEIEPVAAPERVDEVLTRSEAREDDRFDLPPPE